MKKRNWTEYAKYPYKRTPAGLRNMRRTRNTDDHKRRYPSDNYDGNRKDQLEVDTITAGITGAADELDALTIRLRDMQGAMYLQDDALQRIYEQAGVQYTGNPYAVADFEEAMHQPRKPTLPVQVETKGRAYTQERTMDEQLDRAALNAQTMVNTMEAMQIRLKAHRFSVAWHKQALAAIQPIRARSVGPPKQPTQYEWHGDGDFMDSIDLQESEELDDSDFMDSIDLQESEELDAAPRKPAYQQRPFEPDADYSHPAYQQSPLEPDADYSHPAYQQKALEPETHYSRPMYPSRPVLTRSPNLRHRTFWDRTFRTVR